MSREKNERVSSQVMELKDLIAGPLVATIDADSLSAQRYLDYLFKIAFETYDPKTGKTGRLRMLTFNYRSRDLSGARIQSVSIPLLTLVPLPLLQIQEADFDFDIQVLDASSKQQQSSFSFDTGRSEKAPDDPAGNDTRLRVALAVSSGGKADQTESREGRHERKYESSREDAAGGHSGRIVHVAEQGCKQHGGGCITRTGWFARRYGRAD